MTVLETFSMALFFAFSALISLADLQDEEVPRAAFLAAFPVFFALRVGWGRFPLREAAVGLFVGLLVFLLGRIISGGKLGLADVWYSALIGMVLGPKLWYGAVGLACVGAMVLLLVLRRHRIPFIPLMAGGSIIMSLLQGWLQ